MSIAVIGAGYWGSKHIEELVALKQDLVVVDTNVEVLNELRNKFGICTQTDYKDVLSDRDNDISHVVICTPNEYHYEIAKAFLKVGINVLIEKPLALTHNDSEELIQLAKENYCILSVGHIFRFNNAIREVASLIDNNYLGDIRIIKCQWCNEERLFDDRDVIFDLAVHPLDIIHYIFEDSVTNLSCIGNAFRREKSEGTEAVFINGYLDAALVNIELSWVTTPKTRDLTIVGSKCTLIVNCTTQTIDIYENGKKSNYQIVQNNTLRDELDYFLSRGLNSQNISNGEIGLEIVKMIEACNKSMENNQ